MIYSHSPRPGIPGITRNERAGCRRRRCPFKALHERVRNIALRSVASGFRRATDGTSVAELSRVHGVIYACQLGSALLRSDKRAPLRS